MKKDPNMHHQITSNKKFPACHLPSLKTDLNHSRITHSISSFNFPTPVSNDSPSIQEETPEETKCHESSSSNKKSRKTKPAKSPSQQQENETAPGFIIRLGFGLEEGKIVRTVNYERIPVRVVRKATPTIKQVAKKRGSLITSASLEPMQKSRRQRLALISSPRAPSARALSSMKEITTIVSSPVSVVVRPGNEGELQQM